jgi:small subunit ribosomal protein S13
MTEEKQVEKKKNPFIAKEEPTGKIVRIMQTDIPGNKTVYAGLTRIKGISWAISNVLCLKMGISRTKKIEELSKEEMQKIEEKMKNIDCPKFMLNRRDDFTTGKSSHIITTDLDYEKEMDIKRLKKIRSYRGLRHATGQPTRGQSTRSHFRTNRKRGVGMKVNKPVTTMRQPEKK